MRPVFSKNEERNDAMRSCHRMFSDAEGTPLALKNVVAAFVECAARFGVTTVVSDGVNGRLQISGDDNDKESQEMQWNIAEDAGYNEDDVRGTWENKEACTCYLFFCFFWFRLGMRLSF